MVALDSTSYCPRARVKITLFVPWTVHPTVQVGASGYFRASSFCPSWKSQIRVRFGGAWQYILLSRSRNKNNIVCALDSTTYCPSWSIELAGLQSQFLLPKLEIDIRVRFGVPGQYILLSKQDPK